MTNKYDESDWEALELEVKDQFSPYLTKQPTQEDTQLLIQKLQPHLDELVEVVQQQKTTRRFSIWEQVKNQFKQLSMSFWLLSFAVFLMVNFISKSMGFNNYDLSANLYQPIVLLLPAYLLLALFYTFRSWNREMRAIETATPFPPALLLLIRMMLVFIVFIVFSFISTFYVVHGQSTPTESTRLILNWLAPSILVFSTVAFCMYYKGVVIGMIVALIDWLMYLGLPFLLNVIGFSIYTPMFFIQIALCILGVCLFGMVLIKSRSRFDLFIR